MGATNQRPDKFKQWHRLVDWLTAVRDSILLAAVGQATEAKQDDIITALAGIDTINSKINVDTNDLEREVWDKVPGQVKTITYYISGIEAGNLSGNKNVKNISYTGSADTDRPDFSQLFTWDVDDDIVTITAS